MKNLSEFWQTARELARLRGRKLKPKQKQLLKIGCVALAMSLTLGAVPFLKGHAAEGDNTVTKSDIVESVTDPAEITDPEENTDPADDDSDDSELITLSDEIQPKLTGENAPFTTGTITATFSDGVLTLSGSGTLNRSHYSNVKNHFGISEIDIRTLNIGGDISKINDYCFQNQLGVNGANISINIGDSVEVIHNYAFCNGWAINNLSLGSGVQKIGDHAFYGCSALSSVVIPDNVTSIDSYAFDSCFSLNTVTIGRNVRSIGNNAFSQTSLGNVTFKTATIDFFGSNVFGVQDNYQLNISVPCDHFTIGGVRVDRGNMESYFGNDDHVDFYSEASIIQTVPKTEATCTEDGCEKHWECSGCGKYFSDSYGNIEVTPERLVISALGHSLTRHAAVAETCTENGNIEYWECTRDICGIFFSDENGETEITEASTVIPAHHTLSKVEAKEETCTEPGNTEHWKCDVCGKLFGDENGTTEITEASTVIPTHHTLIHHDAVPATCTEPGNIEYWECSKCGGLFGDENGTNVLEIKNITIAATGHDYAWHTYKNDDGTFLDRKICAKCDDLLDEGTFKYALDEEKSGKEWTTGSDQDLFVKIINIADHPGYAKGDDPMIGRLSAVYVDGNELVKDTDYTATAGSIDIRILPGYLKNLSVGKHTVEMKVSYAFVILLPDGSEMSDSDTLSFNHEFTVVKPASGPSSPKTGESEIPMVICMTLMLLAAYGAVYSFTRRKNRQAMTSEAE